jgi:Fic family protein
MITAHDHASEQAPANPRLGRYALSVTAGEQVRAFIPPPLPPEPPLDLRRLQRKLERANQALGRLDGLTRLLPDPHLFIYLYLRKEAVLSSQIEGTQSTLSDLLLFEAEDQPGIPLNDVLEVSNYVAALEHGLHRVRTDLPLSLRLLREIHGILLRRGRGADKTPGEFRTSQNWISGTRPGNAAFVPPPPDQLMECLGALESFLHRADEDLPVLIKAGLAHVQFETIHPFLDGNGRVGRLLVTLMLCVENVLEEPLLYLSLYLKRHKERYYELLQEVRQKGVWEDWLEFFLEGVNETATQAASSAKAALGLVEEDRATIRRLGRGAATAYQVHQHVQQHPVTTIAFAAKGLGLTAPPVAKAIDRLAELGILAEVTGRRRDRVYVYKRYLDLLAEGTEPMSGPDGVRRP